MKKTVLLLILICSIVFGQEHKDEEIKHYTVNLFGGIGAFPLDANFGIGYFVKDNIIGYTKISALVVPIGFFNYSTSIGVKLIPKHKNYYEYSFELGILFNTEEDSRIKKISFNSYNGIIAKSGIGYIWRSKNNFFIGGNFYLNLMFFVEQPKIAVLPELELLFGISL